MSLENLRFISPDIKAPSLPENEIKVDVYEAMKQRYTTDTYGGHGFPVGTERFVTREGKHFTCIISETTVEFISSFQEKVKTVNFVNNEDLFSQLDNYLVVKTKGNPASIDVQG